MGNRRKTGKRKRVSSKTKNELFREMIKQCDNNLWFDYVATDSWFSSVENMKWVKEELNRNFVMALKSNRKVALSLEAKQKKEYVKIESLQPGQQTVNAIKLRNFHIIYRFGGALFCFFGAVIAENSCPA